MFLAVLLKFVVAFIYCRKSSQLVCDWQTQYNIQYTHCLFVCLFVFAHVQTVIAVCWGGWALTESMTLFYQPLHLASHLKIVLWWLILFITDANKRALWLWLNSHISMPSGQFSHFRDKMSLARDTGHSRSIPGRSRPFRDGWQA